MIVDFSFGNFKSFKDTQTLNMTAANIVSKFKTLDDNNVIKFNDINLLKMKAVYGPNASGKSNIIQALVTFIKIVNKSFKDDSVLSNVQNFRLSTDSINEPAFLQLKFIINNKVYRYGFEADENAIHSEWLFESKNLKKEQVLFTRTKDTFDINEKSFKEGQKLRLITKDDNVEQSYDKVLMLSLGKAMGGAICKAIERYISSIIVVNGLGFPMMRRRATEALGDKDFKDKITKMLKTADVGISEIELVEITENDISDVTPIEFAKLLKEEKKISEIFTSHPIYDADKLQVADSPFLLSRDESEGTKKMFELSVFIIEALEDGRPLFIDEFDAKFHPQLSHKLIELFNSPTNTSTQFIIMTHDTALISPQILRRDQIAFVEKNKFGSSKLYSLVDFKGVRNDASLEKDYNNGKFGAIPFIGNFESVLN